MFIYKKKYIDKSVIKKKMANGDCVYYIKFIYDLYVFGKKFGGKDVFDKITFMHKNDAIGYAKIASRPSTRSSDTDYYGCFSGIRKVHTTMDSQIAEINNLLIDLYRDWLKVKWKSQHPGAVSKNIYSNIRYKETFNNFGSFYIKNLDSGNVISDDHIDGTLKKFFDTTETIIKYMQDKISEVKKQSTVIETEEIKINKNNSSNYKKIIKKSQLDEEREKIIRDELARIDETRKLLTKMLE